MTNLQEEILHFLRHTDLTYQEIAKKTKSSKSYVTKVRITFMPEAPRQKDHDRVEREIPVEYWPKTKAKLDYYYSEPRLVAIATRDPYRVAREYLRERGINLPLSMIKELEDKYEHNGN